MKPSRWLLIALVAKLIALTPLADARPPDPSWIPGFYDDGDFDEVAARITLAAGSVETTPLQDRCPVPGVAEVLAPIAEPGLPSALPFSRPGRGPPPIRSTA